MRFSLALILCDPIRGPGRNLTEVQNAGAIVKHLIVSTLLAAAIVSTAYADQQDTALGGADAGPNRLVLPDRADLKVRMKMAAIYLKGDSVERDVERALEIYESAAADGVAFAQHRLARIYLDGDVVPPQPELAFDWYLRAARLGFVDAQIDLSRLYADGLGVKPDQVEAHKWLDLAVSLGAVDLEERQQALADRMSFAERIQARYLANKCKLNRYENC